MLKGLSYKVMQIKRKLHKGLVINGYVNIDDIKISSIFLMHSPNPTKMKYKRRFYRTTGKFDSQIELNKNYVLLNGYTSYIIAKEKGLDKVFVKFVN